MSTEPEKRKDSLISNIKNIINLVSEETRATINMIFKGVKSYNLAIPKPSTNTILLSIENIKTVNVKDVKPIYVLTKDFFKFLVEEMPETKAIGIPKFEFSICKFNKFEIERTIKNLTVKTFNVISRNYPHVVFDPSFKNIENFKFNKPELDSIPIEKIKSPSIEIEDMEGFKTKIFQRSESFPTNLPIERKPINLMLFSNEELDFFKEKLAQKLNAHKRVIKVSSIYNKLNVKNIQNLKCDARTGNLFFNYKPIKKQSSDDIYVYLLTGYRRDNNKKATLMVTEIEFIKFFDK